MRRDINDENLTVSLKLMNPREQVMVSMIAKKQAAPGLEAEKYPILKNTLFRKPILCLYEIYKLIIY